MGVGYKFPSNIRLLMIFCLLLSDIFVRSYD